MHKDSYMNTFLIAISVCLVCSFLVSSAAVGLKELQAKNADKDKKKNILQAAGFDSRQIEEAGGVFELFRARVEPIIIKLETGKQEGIEKIVEYDDTDALNTVDDAVEKYDQIAVARSKAEGLVTTFDSKKEDIAGITAAEKWSHVYLVKSEDGSIQKYVFPIRGKGLWSILKGFVAVENDFQTIAGLTYYEHAETPGLGGEVDNPNWKEKWIGKAIYDEQGEVAIEVIKGSASADEKFAVDGLSGATITSRGVTNMLHFWLGPRGFGPFIQNRKNGESVSSAVSAGHSSGEG